MQNATPNDAKIKTANSLSMMVGKIVTAIRESGQIGRCPRMTRSYKFLVNQQVATDATQIASAK